MNYTLEEYLEMHQKYKYGLIDYNTWFGYCEDCLKVALKSLIPMKPKNIKHLKDDILSYSECPCCGEGVNEEMKFCSECGQKLDWSEKK